MIIPPNGLLSLPNLAFLAPSVYIAIHVLFTINPSSNQAYSPDPVCGVVKSNCSIHLRRLRGFLIAVSQVFGGNSFILFSARLLHLCFCCSPCATTLYDWAEMADSVRICVCAHLTAQPALAVGEGPVSDHLLLFSSPLLFFWSVRQHHRPVQHTRREWGFMGVPSNSGIQSRRHGQ